MKVVRQNIGCQLLNCKNQQQIRRQVFNDVITLQTFSLTLVNRKNTPLYPPCFRRKKVIKNNFFCKSRHTNLIGLLITFNTINKLTNQFSKHKKSKVFNLRIANFFEESRTRNVIPFCRQNCVLDCQKYFFEVLFADQPFLQVNQHAELCLFYRCSRYVFSFFTCALYYPHYLHISIFHLVFFSGQGFSLLLSWL